MRRLLLATALLAIGGPLWANDMTLHGTLIEPPPCSINSGNVVDVDFGSRVGIKKVDGSNYKQTVPYTITCNPGSNPWEMQLKLSGTATSFDGAAVQTDVQNLGIRVLRNGTPFVLGTAVAVDPASLPVLEVVPVKTPGSTLTEGAFNATATLQADYQ